MSVNYFFKATPLKRMTFFLTVDVLISFLTIYLAYLLRFNFDIPLSFIDGMFKMIWIFIPIKISIFLFFKIYFIAWRFFGLVEYRRIIVAHFISYTLFTLLYLFFTDYFIPFPRSVIVIDLFLSIFFIGFLRISKRLYLENPTYIHKSKMLIVGTNESATHIIKSALRGEIDYQPTAMISDDLHTIGTYFSNIKVYDKKSMALVIKDLEIDVVVIAEKLEQYELDRLVTILNELGIHEIKIVQIFQDNQPELADISIEDLLARKPQDLDLLSIANFIVGKVVMITGAGGSIGSELSRQVHTFGAKHIILVDNSEFNLYSINEELNDSKSVPVMQNVRDRDLLEKTFALYKPDIVIHAAAYKHVPLCEANIQEAINNNIFGTKNVIDLSIAYGVAKVVLVSTDKAVRPTNVMGTTKRICELYAQNSNGKGTDIVAVRFGNVLGSSGSVIPKFQEQIEKGGPITVTHPDITRYFMLIPEACELVLQAAAIGTGGEIFILDMGEPIKIVDLANRMIKLSGKQDINIKFTGLRPGEKLYEELLINDSDCITEYKSITVAKPTKYDIETLNKDIKELFSCNDKIKQLNKIVPEFKHELNIIKK